MTKEEINDYSERCLSEDVIRSAHAMLGLRDETLPELLSMADIVRNNESLLTLAASLHQTLFADNEGPGTWEVPYPLEILPDEEHQGPFNLLVALGYAPIYLELNRARNVPEEILADSLKQLSCYDYNFHKKYPQRSGIVQSQLCWLHTYMPPRKYFRLGRLEFALSKFRHPYTVYENIKTKESVAVLKEGFAITPDGVLCYTDEPAPEDAVTSSVEIKDNILYGHAVVNKTMPEESCEKYKINPVALPLSDWQAVIKEGDTVLDMHIPSGDRMSKEMLTDSITSALPFYNKYFPEDEIVGITSSSWLFSEQLCKILPPESNILAFQSLVNILPLPPNKGSGNGLWFVFQSVPPYADYSLLPAETSLQRAIIEWLKKGNRFRQGGLYLTLSQL